MSGGNLEEKIGKLVLVPVIKLEKSEWALPLEGGSIISYCSRKTCRLENIVGRAVTLIWSI
jgi:hypothetical protein